MRRCLTMTADPCREDPSPRDHLVFEGRVYDVDAVADVGEQDDTGATLLEVWARARGEGDGQRE
jgi:hypothetical protein